MLENRCGDRELLENSPVGKDLVVLKDESWSWSSSVCFNPRRPTVSGLHQKKRWQAGKKKWLSASTLPSWGPVCSTASWPGDPIKGRCTGRGGRWGLDGALGSLISGGNPAHGKGVGTEWTLRSLPTEDILWCYDSSFLVFWAAKKTNGFPIFHQNWIRAIPSFDSRWVNYLKDDDCHSKIKIWLNIFWT